MENQRAWCWKRNTGIFSMDYQGRCALKLLDGDCRMTEFYKWDCKRRSINHAEKNSNY